MINKVTLIGNAGAEPELKQLENGTLVCRLSLATNESYKDKAGEWQTQTEWHQVIFWRDLADRAAHQIKKGTLVYLEGKIGYRKYTGTDGVEKYATDIVCSTFRKLEKSDGTNDRNFPTDEPGRYATNENPTGGNAEPAQFTGLPDVSKLPDMKHSGMGPETLAANPPDDTLPF